MSLSIDISRFTKAEELLWSFGIVAPEHIDLEAIAFAQGAVVQYQALDGCDARLIGTTKNAVITINNRSSRTRQRFSLAHEIAHWTQDRRNGGFLCAKDDIGAHKAELKGVEASANAYASQLILPNYLFDPVMRDSKLSLDRAGEIAKLFDASLTATAIKMIKRSDQAAFVIRHTKERREWFIRGNKFPQEYWVLDEMHPDTPGFTMLYGPSSGMSRAVEEPANRWISGPRAYAMSARSQSVKLPDDSVLSLVSMVVR